MIFREFSNPEEQDFDIKSSVDGYKENNINLPNNSFDNDAAMELCDLIGLLEDDEFENIEELYGITEYEYMHPTKEVVEKVKDYLENVRGKSR